MEKLVRISIDAKKMKEIKAKALEIIGVDTKISNTAAIEVIFNALIKGE